MISSKDWELFAHRTQQDESYVIADHKCAAFIEGYAQRSIKIRETCKHPSFYLHNDSTDSYERRQNWDCQCVNCGKIKSEHSRYYEGKLIMGEVSMGNGKRSDFSYEEVYKTFHELKENGIDEQIAVERVLKQYKHQPKVKQL